MRKINKFYSIILILIFTLTAILTPMLSSAQTAITRDQVEQRALKMINLQWNYSKYKNSTVSSTYSDNVALPKQLINITSGTMTGIPYSWGGLDGIDTSSYNTPWDNFLQAINQGAYAGNVNTKSGMGYIPGTAGLDCSGFMQASFNIIDSKLSTTTTFNKYFYKIDIKDIKHMDILNKPGYHTVIFDKWGYYNGVYGAYTYESTVDQYRGGIQGAKKYFRSMNEINNGYIPGRYINILDSQPTQVSEPTIKPGIYAQIVNVTSYANFRSQHSATATIIGTIPKGGIIFLKSYSNGWYEVNYNENTGWVYGNLVGLLESGKYVTIKNVTMLNIRQSASSTSTIIGTLSTGEFAEVLGYSADGKWYKINKNGLIGWSSGAYLSYIY